MTGLRNPCETNRTQGHVAYACTNCNSHLLELAVVSVSQGIYVLGARSVSWRRCFEGSACCIEKVMHAGRQCMELKSPCPARWTQHGAPLIEKENLWQIVQSLEIITKECSSAGSDVYHLLRKVESFECMLGSFADENS